MIKFTLNGEPKTAHFDGNTPLLWVIREEFQLTGTKFGCGMGLCGACTVHLDGQVIRSCITPLSSVQGKSVNTIESISKDNSHPVQQAWIEENVPQCGYCQSGQIMAAAALLENNAEPEENEIEAAMAGHLCRCGSYQRVAKAIKRVINKNESS